MELKLNYKKTIKVGFAFAIIILFWSVYDFVVPLLLENAFGLSNFWRGAIMGLDNLLSLFMLPLFGKFSDKTKTKYGRRTPYIVIGTVLAVIFMVFIPVSASAQLKEANALRTDLEYSIETDSVVREGLLTEWYDLAASKDYSLISAMDFRNLSNIENINTAEEYASIKYTEIKSEEGVYYKGNRNAIDAEEEYTYEEISEAEYNSLSAENATYKKYVVGSVSTYISNQVNSQITQQNTGRLVVYLIVLFFVLLAMGIFRSPAGALMPDVTPKPLRSQANAIINLAGGVGGAIAFIIYTVAFIINDNAFTAIYIVTAGCMLGLLAVFLILVKEPKMVEECRKIEEEYGITDEDIEKIEISQQAQSDGAKDTIYEEKAVVDAEKKKLEKAKFRSFLLILSSIFMWFMGYNAVSSNLSVYCVKVLNLSAGGASIISGASMAISAIAFIPVGMLAVKIGRKKSIMLGFLLAVISYALVWVFVRPGEGVLPAVLFASFYLVAGFGLIIANVNTFPMVVELSKSEDVGKYTGYYYMATMSAQAITPAIAGLFMDYVGNYALFGYSAVCVIIAIVLMYLVKHGDSKPLPKKTALENFSDD